MSDALSTVLVTAVLTAVVSAPATAALTVWVNKRTRDQQDRSDHAKELRAARRPAWDALDEAASQAVSDAATYYHDPAVDLRQRHRDLIAAMGVAERVGPPDMIEYARNLAEIVRSAMEYSTVNAPASHAYRLLGQVEMEEIGDGPAGAARSALDALRAAARRAEHLELAEAEATAETALRAVPGVTVDMRQDLLNDARSNITLRDVLGRQTLIEQGFKSARAQLNEAARKHLGTDLLGPGLR